MDSNNIAAETRRPSSPAPRRKRGAQPGNQNAVTHGFYARYFTLPELADLDELKARDPQPEIDALRVSLRRMFELSAEPATRAEAIEALDAIGKATDRVVNMLLKQVHLVEGADAQLTDVLNAVLAELNAAHRDAP